MPLLKTELMARTGLDEKQINCAAQSLFQRKLMQSNFHSDRMGNFSIYTLTPEGERMARQMIEVAA